MKINTRRAKNKRACTNFHLLVHLPPEQIAERMQARSGPISPDDNNAGRVPAA